MSSSLGVLLEVKTTHSSAVLSLHLSQCFTPPLKSIPASFFPHAPCPPSWIPSLPAILTPVLRMCHLFKTTYATLGACLSTDTIWLSKPRTKCHPYVMWKGDVTGKMAMFGRFFRNIPQDKDFFLRRYLSFYLSRVAKTQLNHWNKRLDWSFRTQETIPDRCRPRYEADPLVH